MKEPIRKLLIALVTLAAIPQLHAVVIYPFTTNATYFNGVGASSGTNYMVTLVDGIFSEDLLVANNGATNGKINLVGNTTAPFLPCAAYAGTNYLVLWCDDTTNWHSQPVTTDGTKFGTTNAFISGAGGRALLTDHTNFLVAWQQTNSGYFYGQFLNPSGVTNNAPFLLAAESKNLAGTFGATNYFFIWQNTNGVSTNYNTYGAFVSESGSVGTPFQISVTASLDQSAPAVGFDGTNFFAVWNTDTARNASNAPIWSLYGRLVTQSGTFASGELLLNSNQPMFPSVAFGQNQYLVSWSHDLDTTNTDKQVVFQFYNRSASAVGDTFTPFPAMGTNLPLYGGPLFNGQVFSAVATLGTVTVSTNGTVTYNNGAIYGTFLSYLPILVASNYTSAQFSLTLNGVPGVNYAIRYVTNADADNWTPLVTNSPNSNGIFNFTDPNATNGARFYRAEQQ